MTTRTPPPELRAILDIVADLDSASDALAVLALIKELHDWHDAALPAAVGCAMAQGFTGKEIGAVLGISQQAVSKRFGCGNSDEDEKEPAVPRAKPEVKTKAFVNYDLDGGVNGYSLPIDIEDLARLRASVDVADADATSGGSESPCSPSGGGLRPAV